MATRNSSQSPSSVTNQASQFNTYSGNFGQSAGKTDTKSAILDLVSSLTDDKTGSQGSDILSVTSFSESGHRSPSLATQASSGQNIGFRSARNSGDAMLSAINYNANEILQEGSFDVGVATNLDLGDSLINSGTGSGTMSNPSNTTYDLFDGDASMGDYNIDSQQDLQLSPHTYPDTAMGLHLPDQEQRQAESDVDIANALVSLRTGGYHQPSQDEERAGGVESQIPVPPSAGAGVTSSGDKPRGKGRPSKVSTTGGRQGVQCQMCGKVFNNSSALAKHKLTHSDERKYVCPICSKAFKRQDHLNGHMMTHRSKKPFECKFEGCDKSYCDARSLRRHLENHHQQTLEALAANTVGNNPTTTSSCGTARVGGDTSGQFFRFDQQMPPPSTTVPGLQTWHSETQKSPGYLQQVSPISPAPGPHPTSPLDKQAPGRLYPSTINPLSLLEEPKPVQCNLCHRRFKNIPALNGHMRLHGGYFKKDLQTEEATQVSKPQQTTTVKTLQPPPPPKKHIPPPLTMPGSLRAGYHSGNKLGSTGSFTPQPEVHSPRIPGPMSHGAHSQMNQDVQSPQQVAAHQFGDVQQTLQQHQINTGGLHLKSEIQSPSHMTATSQLQQEIQSPHQLTAPRQFQSQADIHSPGPMSVPPPSFQELQSPTQRNAPHQFQTSMQSPHQISAPIEITPSIQSPCQTTAPQQFTQALQSPLQTSAPQQFPPALQSPLQKSAPQQFTQHLQSPLQTTAPQQFPPPLQSPLQTTAPQQFPPPLQSPHQTTAPQQFPPPLQSPLQTTAPQQFPPALQSPLQTTAPQQFPPALQSPLQTTAPQQFPPALQSPRQATSSQQYPPDLHSPRQTTSSQQFPPNLQSPLQTNAPQQFPPDMTSPHPVNNQQSQFEFPQSTFQSDYIPPSQVETVGAMPGVQTQPSLCMASQSQTMVSNMDQSLVSNSGSTNIIAEMIQQHLLGQQTQPMVQDSADLNEQLMMSQAFETISQQNALQGNVQAGVADLALQQGLQQNFVGIENTGYTTSIGGSQQALQSPGPHPHTPNHPMTPTHAHTMVNQYGSHPPTPNHPLTPTAHHSHPATPSQPLTPNQPLSQHHVMQQTTDSQMFKFPPQPVEITTQSATISFPKSLPLPDSVRLENIIKGRPGELLERKRRASADPDKFTQPKKNQLLDDPLSLLLGSVDEKFLQPDPTIGLLEEADKILQQRESETIALQAKDKNDNINNSGAHRYSEDSYSDGRGGKQLNLILQKSQLLPQEIGSARPAQSVGKVMYEVKQEVKTESSVFRNPSSQVRPKKKKHRPEPLKIPPHSSTMNYGYPSMIRSPRIPGQESKGCTPPPYTPPPMLSPIRSGTGLFWTIHSGYKPKTPKSAPIFPIISISRQSSSSSSLSETIEEEPEVETEQEPPPETDVTPHVNVGSNYQAPIPDLITDRKTALSVPDPEELMWDPALVDEVTEEEVQWYLDFACCAAVPGNGLNKELALHLLQLTKGSIMDAMLMLMNGELELPENHTLLTYKYQETDPWSSEEIESYYQALMKCDKDFFSIAKEIPSKSVKQCVQFYYLWKKVCPDEYKRLRIIRRKREQDELYNLRSRLPAQQPAKDEDTMVSENSSPSPKPESQVFNSRQTLDDHVRGHRSTVQGSERATPSPGPPSRPPSNKSALSEEGDLVTFPCKICGKVFGKVKSRNAHMKSHRQTERQTDVNG